MTELELRCARAIKKVNFMPGSRTKAFAVDMAKLADEAPGWTLSARQRETLFGIVVSRGRSIANVRTLFTVFHAVRVIEWGVVAIARTFAMST